MTKGRLYCNIWHLYNSFTCANYRTLSPGLFWPKPGYHWIVAYIHVEEDPYLLGGSLHPPFHPKEPPTHFHNSSPPPTYILTPTLPPPLSLICRPPSDDLHCGRLCSIKPSYPGRRRTTRECARIEFYPCSLFGSRQESQCTEHSRRVWTGRLLLALPPRRNSSAPGIDSTFKILPMPVL